MRNVERPALHRDFAIGTTDPRLFGAFVEHLGRCVYGGIFEPGHPTADAQGLPPGRAGAGARARRRPSCAIPAATSSPATTGRTASARSSERPRAARPRLDVDRDQHVRHQRVHRLVPRGRHRADAGGQPRHARRRCGAQPGRVLQPSRRHGAVRPAPQARLGQAARRQVLVPRQRDGRPVADGGEDRDRVRPHRRRGGQDDEVDRSRRSSWPPAARRAATCRPSAPGKTRCWSTPSTTSSTSRCTPISTTTPTTRRPSSPAPT